MWNHKQLDTFVHTPNFYPFQDNFFQPRLKGDTTLRMTNVLKFQYFQLTSL